MKNCVSMEKGIVHYPRKMRVGWCVAHEVTAAGVAIERYGVRCRTYQEAYQRAEEMNRKQAEEIDRKQQTAAADAATAAAGGVPPQAGQEEGGAPHE